MPSLAQINLKKACTKNELHYVKPHLWASEGFYPGGGAVGDFPKIFPGRLKVVKFLFAPRN